MRTFTCAVVAAGIALPALLAGCSGVSGTLTAPEDLSFSYCVGVDNDSRELVFGFPVVVDTASSADSTLESIELIDPINADLKAAYVQAPGVLLPSAQDVEDFDATAEGVSPLEGFRLGSDESVVQVLVDVEGDASESSAGFSGIRLEYQSPAGALRVLELPMDIAFELSCNDDGDVSEA
jgi:hypothetical protein